MFKKLTGFLGDSNEREIKRLVPAVNKINALEPDFEKLSDDALRAKTSEFKNRLSSGESLEDILPEAFAAVREASKRTLGQRHFNVQLLGGMVLHHGKIAEMKTGEGKTLVATLPVYLNSLTGKGVHIVTVNDYLSKRDPHWMGPIYHALGASVGCIQHESSFIFDPGHDSGDAAWPRLHPVSRKQAYDADITYGTNNELGFDYLRDNIVSDLSQKVQRRFNYAIVDEVDNILIDEARTPLIISGQAEEATQKYYTFARLVPRLQAETDYTIDLKTKAAIVTESGIAKMENWLGVPNLYDPANYGLVHYMENALRAHAFYKRDREYVVKDGEVIIVDEFTGRMMSGRRYSEGLHQAIEAQEGVKIQRESITLATVTFQNFFRMYEKLAGMTGTAVTEAEEFHKIYKLDVVAVPTNKDLIRKEYNDQIYKTQEGKFRAVVREIEEQHNLGRPVLVGTVAIETSEHLSEMLTRRGVPHQVLNAKQHEKEARIIAEAGRLGAVTIATNMAGRGVDIILGGTPSHYKPYEDEFEYHGSMTREFTEPGVRLLEEQKAFKGWEKDYEARLDQARNAARLRQENIKRLHSDLIEACNATEPDGTRLFEINKDIDEQERLLSESLQEYRSLAESQSSEFEGQLNLYLSDAEKQDSSDTAKRSIIQRIKSILAGLKKARADKPAIAEVLLRYRKAFRDWLEERLKVIELGGLHIVGTERHESRRIDNQLRGRAGRQGDPGSSRFYVSLEDDIMRRFGGDRIGGIMDRLGFDEDTPIEHSLISKAIENTQVKVEGYHFDVRKHLLEYDDVLNKHREMIYGEREKLLGGADLRANIRDMIDGEISSIVSASLVDEHGDEWNLDGLAGAVGTIFPLTPEVSKENLARMSRGEIGDKLLELAGSSYDRKEQELGTQNMRIVERLVMLRAIDNHWREHLTALEEIRQGIGLQAYAQKDPLIAYKKEAHEMFQQLQESIQHDIVHTIYHVGIVQKSPSEASKKEAAVGALKKVGRNDPCPCGSGKKYKKCCGSSSS